ncbi:MAG: immunoglobulin domain-containing protein [Verrucomicrobiota bacterium]
MNTRFSTIGIRIFAALFFLGSSARAVVVVDPWVPIFKGIDFARGKADTNEVRLQEVQAMRIDLSDSNVVFFSTPSNGDAPLETFGQTTSTFLLTYGVQAAVNANFFSPVSTTPNEPRELLGLAISQGTIVSPSEIGYEMLLITASNQASIAATPPASFSNIYTAVAGSDILVVNGVNQGAVDSPNPRTAVGISQDNRYLYFVTIDGRQPGYSDGATLNETAQWLIRFGTYNGLNLDGGGSTAMVKAESGGATVLNRPSGGVQRVNGNHIGVFAPQLPPVILTAPQSQTALIGQNASFSVGAGGTAPLRYQWRFQGANISGAIGTNLFLTNVQPANAGSYVVVITNNAGAITSTPAILNANYALTAMEGFGGTIAKSPNQTSYAPGAVVMLNAIADPGFVFTGWSGDDNSTNNPLSLTMTTHKTVTANFSGSVPDIILDNPGATLVGSWTTNIIAADKFGSNYLTATTVAAASSPSKNVTYRPNIFTPGKYAVYLWYPTDLIRSTNAPWTVSFDGGTATTRINQTNNGGAWRLIFTGQDFLRGTNGFVRLGNNANGAAQVMADAVRFVFGTPPMITIAPQNLVVTAGENANFSVAASGSGPLQYQWRFNSSNIMGATASNFTVNNAQGSAAGNYSVVITNDFGAVTSSVAVLTVNVPPSISAQPQSRSVAQATNITFSVTATGTAPLNFRWRFNGSNIAGAISSAFTLTNVQASDAGNYSVLVSNFVGMIVSSNATLAVSATPVAPSVTGPPQSQTAIAGQNIIFHVTANGTLPLNYQWRFDGENISGANASTLTITNVQPANVGNYSVMVANSAGATNSSAASLVVNYSLAANATLGGSVAKSPEQSSYAPGSMATLTAMANANFNFIGWVGDATGTNNPLTVLMNTNKNIIAQFSGAVADIILDNANAAYSGAWTIGTTAAGRYGVDYHFAGTSLSNATATAVYRPNITTAGRYDVYIWYPQGGNRASNAPWEIISDDGTQLTLVNQQTGGGSWQLIGAAKNFAPGTNGFVRLSNNANNSVVIADAVRFSFVFPPAPSVPQLLSPRLISPGEFAFIFLGQTGFIYAIDSSLDLTNWNPVANFFHDDDALEFIAPITTEPGRFYRARWIP